MFAIEFSLEKRIKKFLADGFSVIPEINAFGFSSSDLVNLFQTVYLLSCRYLHQPATVTCTNAFTKEFAPSIVHHVVYFSVKRHIYKNIKKHRVTYKPPTFSRKRNETACWHPRKPQDRKTTEMKKGRALSLKIHYLPQTHPSLIQTYNLRLQWHLIPTSMPHFRQQSPIDMG